MKQTIFRTVIGILVFAIVASFAVQPVQAWHGRAWNCAGSTATRTYFDNRCLPTIEGGDHFGRVVLDGIPGWVNNTDTYFSWLQQLYASGGRNQTAASYIVNTMLGYDNALYGRTVGGDQWAALQARLPAHSMSYENHSSYGVNTRMMSTGSGSQTGGPEAFDVQAFRQEKFARAWVFRDASGAEKYIIFIDCANPVGELPGLSDVPALDYNLTPSISVAEDTAESGGALSVVPSVNNGGSTASRDNNWEVVKFFLNPGDPVPSAGQSNSNPTTAYYGNGAQPVASGVQNFPKNVFTIPLPTQFADDLAVGTRLCFALSVSPLSQTDGRWNHSAPDCVVIAKSPKVQVLGGDLLLGRKTASSDAAVSNVSTSVSFLSSTGKYYGSWTEYALIPSGTVSKMASAAGYSGGSNTGNICSMSLLTVANNQGTSCDSTQLGMFTHSKPVPNVADRFSPTAPGPISNSPGATVDISTVTPSLIYTTSQSELNITSANAFGAGRWVVINAPSTTVTIKSNINYTDGTLSAIADIPQVVIIAKNIIIADNVTNVDAWLVATGGALVAGQTAADGFINTCGSSADGSITTATLPTSEQCNQVLTINGPVMANHLIMRRTGGAGPGALTGDPSEIFNLRADSYIWASSYSPGTGRIPTSSTKELPPRF